MCFRKILEHRRKLMYTTSLYQTDEAFKLNLAVGALSLISNDQVQDNTVKRNLYAS